MIKGSAIILYICIASSIIAQTYEEKSLQANISHTTYAPHAMAGGVAIIDYNNDGFEDLYFIGGMYPDHLYKNNGDESFEDVSSLLGIDKLKDRYTMGVAAGDLDNDGFTDLFITTYKGDRNICLRNISGQRFDDVTIDAGFFGTKWSTAPTMGDIDLDGDLDVYVSNFVDFEKEPFFNHITDLEPNFLYENEGSWNFNGRSELLQNGKSGCTLVSCFSDFDGDLDPDLFVINDFGGRFTSNELYVNDSQNQQYIERGQRLNMDAKMDGMGIATGDINQDGVLDYYLTNIGDNLLYLGGEKDKGFQNSSDNYKVNDGLGYSWGTFFADLNNDSYQDLYVAKGTISESDIYQSNKLYQYNESIENFDDVTMSAHLDDGSKARGAVYADLNNDGWLDIVVNNVKTRDNNQDRAAIYFNRQSDVNEDGGNFVQLQLKGTTANSSAIGARVTLYSDNRQLVREVQGGASYLSHNSPIVHFGLARLSIDSINVKWPGSASQTYYDIERNTRYLIIEGDMPKVLQQETTTATSNLSALESAPLYVFPNPVFDHRSITINNLKNGLHHLVIIDINGRIISSETYHHSQTLTKDIDVSHLTSGLYIIQLFNKSGLTSLKFLKE